MREPAGDIPVIWPARRWADVVARYAEHTDVIHPLDPFRAPALLSREELREHFSAIGDRLGDLHFQPRP